MSMPITSDLRPPEPLPRKRPPVTSTAAGSLDSSTETQARSDKLAILSANHDEIKRYVNILKRMNPADLHKVELLRERIASGEYRADPQELAGHLASILEQERTGPRGA